MRAIRDARRRLRRDPRAGLCIEMESPERADGQRPNRQVRAIGRAELYGDEDGVWTRRVTEKWVSGPGAASRSCPVWLTNAS
jgi:hypothetical protein